MILSAFHHFAWLAPVAWACLYTSDYALTLWGQSLYRNGADRHFRIQSSYELTPFFQKDIDAHRIISPRFLIMLGITTCLLLMTRGILFDTAVNAYDAVLGFLFLVEIPIHLRHLRNIFTFHYYRHSEGIEGQVTISRWLSYRVTSFEFVIWICIFIFFYFLSGLWFFLGGALGCLYTVFSFRRCGNMDLAVQTQSSQENPEAEMVIDRPQGD